MRRLRRGNTKGAVIYRGLWRIRNAIFSRQSYFASALIEIHPSRAVWVSLCDYCHVKRLSFTPASVSLGRKLLSHLRFCRKSLVLVFSWNKEQKEKGEINIWRLRILENESMLSNAFIRNILYYLKVIVASLFSKVNRTTNLKRAKEMNTFNRTSAHAASSCVSFDGWSPSRPSNSKFQTDIPHTWTQRQPHPCLNESRRRVEVNEKGTNLWDGPSAKARSFLTDGYTTPSSIGRSRLISSWMLAQHLRFNRSQTPSTIVY